MYVGVYYMEKGFTPILCSFSSEAVIFRLKQKTEIFIEKKSIYSRLITFRVQLIPR